MSFKQVLLLSPKLLRASFVETSSRMHVSLLHVQQLREQVHGMTSQ